MNSQLELQAPSANVQHAGASENCKYKLFIV